MTIVAIAALAVAALALSIAGGVTRWAIRALERKDRLHEARLNVLLDRVMHVVNKTWQSPPSARDHDDEEEQRQEERRRLWDGIIADPEQTIDYPPAGDERDVVFDIPTADIT